MKQKCMFFWNYLVFSMIKWILAIWSLIPLPFLKPTWTSGSSRLYLYSQYPQWVSVRIEKTPVEHVSECNILICWFLAVLPIPPFAGLVPWDRVSYSATSFRGEGLSVPAFIRFKAFQFLGGWIGPLICTFKSMMYNYVLSLRKI